MASSVTASSRRGLRLSGRVLALFWAAFWTWFGIASGFGEGMSVTGIFLHALLPGLIFLAFALLVWKWPVSGAILLLVVGVLVAVAYPIVARNMSRMTIVMVELTMALPPLAAGLLLLASARKPSPPRIAVS